MTLYYKTQYKPFFDQWKSQKKSGSVMPSLIEFVNNEFPGLLASASEKASFEFVELVKLLVFSHRHNKSDDYLKNPLIDFSIVREPMYKYSRHAQDKFFDFATFAFLFAWFEANPVAKLFSAEKFAENDNHHYPERMTTEIAQLGLEAQSKLAQAGPSQTAGAPYKTFMAPSTAIQMRRCLDKYL